MKLSNKDRYSLKVDTNAMSESELREVKFNLNYRWLGHLKRNQLDAAKSAQDLANAIRAELALRAQERHMRGV